LYAYLPLRSSWGRDLMKAKAVRVNSVMANTIANVNTVVFFFFIDLGINNKRYKVYLEPSLVKLFFST
jgi:hypothetical protein